MEWISVEDRLPETYTPVIVDGGCAYFNGEVWITKMECPNLPIQWEVKEWMPLPNPPKDKES